MAEETQERIPVYEKIEVIDSKTLFKTDQWWKAVSFQNAFGNKEIAIYLWKNTDGDWKRKQKATIKDRESWEGMKSGVEEFIDRLE